MTTLDRRASARQPEHLPRLSVLIPAHNEEANISRRVRVLAAALREAAIPFELVVVNDNSHDGTVEIVTALQGQFPELRLVHNLKPSGLGRAIRCGLDHYAGDAVAIVMADLSDCADDVVRCYRMLEQGYDCVFGSRFMKGGSVTDYPLLKRVVNRIVNRAIQLMFWTRHDDLTNAFKVYRRHVIESIKPLHAAHFNITIEMSLSALIRNYRIARLPISWSGRTWGQSNLRLRQMGRRYFCTLVEVWCERILILDDLMAENQPYKANDEADMNTKDRLV